MAAGGISFERIGGFARVRVPGEDHFFRLDKLAGGSLSDDGVELMLAQPLERLWVPCPDAEAAATLWAAVCHLLDNDLPNWRGEGRP